MATSVTTEYAAHREKFNYKSLLGDLREYLESKTEEPFFDVGSDFSSDLIRCIFLDSFIDKILKSPDKLEKPFDVASNFGFKGFSKGGRNGVFYVRDEDKGLILSLNSSLSAHGPEIMRKTGIESLAQLKPVKIVYHNRSGVRVVGGYAEKNRRIIFTGAAKY